MRIPAKPYEQDEKRLLTLSGRGRLCSALSAAGATLPPFDERAGMLIFSLFKPY
jgi:hypothetical protein